MADFSDSLSEKQVAFIGTQPLFFVATATAEGRINLSPKGLDAFRVLGPNRVAYLDLGGSGNETHAHLTADGRITIMFCAFTNPAQILRLYGRGVAVLPQDPGWSELSQHFELLPGTRQIFDLTIESVQSSCGYGVPLMSLDRPRDTLPKYHAKVGKDAWLAKAASRTTSIDGLPTRATERYFGDS